MDRENLHRFQHSSTGKAAWQVINSVGPYLLLWIGMVYAFSVSFWFMLPLAVIAAGFLTRIFIIFHDCGHGSFLASARANRLIGTIAAGLNLTPYQHWRWQHALHHGTAGDLDRRGSGDIWTLTVQEYCDAPWTRRLAYRLARNPVVLLVLAPLYVFVVHHRFAARGASSRERRSVYCTNIGLGLIAGLLCLTIGWKAFVAIQLTVTAIAGAVGVWLFYVQHQFEGAYWARNAHWNYTEAAMQGSSFYKLPKLFQWFTGNIGFHHIHHLSPRIANYHLERCHRSDAVFQQVRPVTFLMSLRSLKFRLWDEARQRFVGFGGLKAPPLGQEAG